MARDVFTEPADLDLDTLANLGPLAPLAGVWEGRASTHPVAEGTEDDEYVDRIELAPIDPQTNGPQLLYGLRYHQHITRPGDPVTFHDQVGYWLWEPATGTVTSTAARCAGWRRRRRTRRWSRRARQVSGRSRLR
jgi:hypothetical protein